MKHLAVVSILIIIFGSITPLPNTNSGEVRISTILNILHLTIYTIYSLIWAISIKSKKTYIKLMIAIIPLTEILQLPLSYRSSNLQDLIFNTVGVIIGYSIYLLIKNRSQTLRIRCTS
jgi:glycopeptide antibiotics resistance protein